MALPLAALAISAAPGIIGGIGQLIGRKRRLQEEEASMQGLRSLSDVFSNQLQGDYMDTGEAQGAIREFKDMQSSQMDEINATANINGLTDEARIAMMKNNNKNAQGFFSNLARSGDLWRSRLLQQKQGITGQIFDAGMMRRQNFNNSLSNIVNPLSDSISTGFSSGAFNGLLMKNGGGQSPAVNPFAGNIAKGMQGYASSKFGL